MAEEKYFWEHSGPISERKDDFKELLSRAKKGKDLISAHEDFVGEAILVRTELSPGSEWYGEWHDETMQFARDSIVKIDEEAFTVYVSYPGFRTARRWGLILDEIPGVEGKLEKENYAALDEEHLARCRARLRRCEQEIAYWCYQVLANEANIGTAEGDWRRIREFFNKAGLFRSGERIDLEKNVENMETKLAKKAASLARRRAKE